MKLELVHGWWQILLFSHSERAIWLGLVVLYAADIIYLATGVDTNPRFWIYASTVLFVYGAVGRVVK